LPMPCNLIDVHVRLFWPWVALHQFFPHGSPAIDGILLKK
jgi:hypothetical protein